MMPTHVYVSPGLAEGWGHGDVCWLERESPSVVESQNGLGWKRPSKT